MTALAAGFRVAQDLPPWLYNVLFPVNRWLHLVASTLLVGGVLFFEFVVPLATEDLKEEQRLAVFGRARWVFRKVAWFSVICLIVTGGLSMWRLWWLYDADQQQAGGFWNASLPWVYGHVILSAVAFAILLRVTRTSRLAGHPVGWMRVILVILLASMFMVSVARQIRLRMRELRELHNLPHEVQPGGDA